MYINIKIFHGGYLLREPLIEYASDVVKVIENQNIDRQSFFRLWYYERGFCIHQPHEIMVES